MMRIHIWSANIEFFFLFGCGVNLLDNDKKEQRCMPRIVRVEIEFVQGFIDYYLFPNRRNSFGGPFNGQSVRKQLFWDVIKSQSPQIIIETGTYRGTTTAMLARSGLPIYTIEKSARNLGFARAQLRGINNITSLAGDSRNVLQILFHNELAKYRDNPIFVYLDAHWGKELPLAQEIEMVFTNAPMAIVMIDDFAVPFDAGYGFDDYGPAGALNADYIAPAVQKHQLYTFYPSTPSEEESGGRRGCVVICKTPANADKLNSIKLLKSG